MNRWMTFSLFQIFLAGMTSYVLADPTNAVTAPSDHVEIYQCAATPYTVIVHQNDTIEWEVRNNIGDSDNSTYTVVFDSDPTKNPLKDKSMPVASTHHRDNSHQVYVDGCTVINTIHGKSCGDFQYGMKWRDWNHPEPVPTDCKDPVVRVMPPSILLPIVFSIASLLALLYYPILRMFDL
jgi:hypothetical protein